MIQDSRIKTKKGFTLIEVLVSTAIITVVMLVAIGAIITIQDANRKAQAVRAVIDNLHGALENMSRKIRTGNTYYCGDVVTDGLSSFSASDDGCRQYGYATALSLRTTDDVDSGDEGAVTVYRMQCSPYSGTDKLPNASTGMCGTDNGVVQKGTIYYYKEGTGASHFADFEPLTDPKIDVKSLRFYVHNATGVPGTYPSVLITVSGSINVERSNSPTPFNIETTISQYIK